MRMRTVLAAAALLIASCVAASANADDAKNDKKPKEPTGEQLKIAKAIATGHAYEKHVVEEKLFPEVKNKDDFAKVIVKVLANPTHHRELGKRPRGVFRQQVQLDRDLQPARPRQGNLL